jgi:acetolactate synthase-like protein
MAKQSGGDLVGDILARHGVQALFTLCGGHTAPILTGAKRHGIRIVDVRDEKSAVFAADAVARMTGIPGVAVVTAGPGVTNTVTAVENAKLAESPLVIFGGSAATLLKGRGALQDIDQLAIMKPLTKWATTVKTLAQLEATTARALEVASSGVPGPVFVEVPVDLLYPEELVREWYFKESGVEHPRGLGGRALKLFLQGHLLKQFRAPRLPEVKLGGGPPRAAGNGNGQSVGAAIQRAGSLIRGAERPVLVVGSQALAARAPADAEAIAEAIRALGMPTYLAGTARGLLGRHADLQFRHQRGKALKEADAVVVAGFPFDFRLGYGRAIGKRATVIAANLSERALSQNRRPELPVHTHPGQFLLDLAAEMRGGGPARWGSWFETLRERERARDDEIASKTAAGGELVDPIALFRTLEDMMDEDAILVVDGGDFVATASYILRPRKPLSWLDPGVFGTLGVGGGFAVGAAVARPGREIWLIYGDGSSAYSLAEIDTCARHGLAPIAIIGNDASWAQIAREQVEVLGDDCGTVLARSDYHRVAEGYGGAGLLLDDPAKTEDILHEAKKLAKAGRPVVINAHLAATDFRKGSISM